MGSLPTMGFEPVYLVTKVETDMRAVSKNHVIWVVSEKICMTPYHPQGNGQCKQFNSTLISMIRMLQDEDKAHWWDFVSSLVHTYNRTKSNAMEFSPYYLMFGQKPR